MNVIVEKRYILLPVSRTAQAKKLIFWENGAIRAELDVRLSRDPDMIMSYDMRRFLGQKLELTVTPEVNFVPAFADEPPARGDEKYRPVSHFSAPAGWINDPNGLVYMDGVYHLFYQHNPVDTVWGNMHWGHAVSADLVHWTDCDEALFPDETGVMYSGSAIVDEKNRTGLGADGVAPLLIYYTAAGDGGEMSRGRDYTQRLAWSTDGGKTLVKYPEPMVECFAPGNRDPKVIFCEEMGSFLMALYLHKHEFMLLRSDDLLKWTPIQHLSLEDDMECPDLFPLTLEGERFWVFSAAAGRYLVGKIVGGLFVPVQSARSLSFGQWYAAQSYSGVKDGRRLRFAWNRAPIQEMPFQSSMSTPLELSLARDSEGIALCVRPASEFDALRTDVVRGRDRMTLPGRSNDIIVDLPEGKSITLTLIGAQIDIDRANGVVACCGTEMPLNGSRRLRVIQDVHALEIYTERGDHVMCVSHMADMCLNRIEGKGVAFTAWRV